MGSLAKFFHFQPSELMNFDIDDLEFWMDRLNEQVEAMKKNMPRGK